MLLKKGKKEEEEKEEEEEKRGGQNGTEDRGCEEGEGSSKHTDPSHWIGGFLLHTASHFAGADSDERKWAQLWC
jgi:hypothetical protein